MGDVMPSNRARSIRRAVATGIAHRVETIFETNNFMTDSRELKAAIYEFYLMIVRWGDGGAWRSTL